MLFQLWLVFVSSLDIYVFRIASSFGIDRLNMFADRDLVNSSCWLPVYCDHVQSCYCSCKHNKVMPHNSGFKIMVLAICNTCWFPSLPLAWLTGVTFPKPPSIHVQMLPSSPSTLWSSLSVIHGPTHQKLKYMGLLGLGPPLSSITNFHNEWMNLIVFHIFVSLLNKQFTLDPIPTSLLSLSVFPLLPK